ncbi:MAG: hypothetical protein IJ337_09425 [Clostridia bacterium]|nr:hypothetical protein [Clostridia bacterium]
MDVLDSLRRVQSQLDSVPLETPASRSYADTQFQIIKKYVTDFYNSLDHDHNVGVILTNFGSTVVIEVTSIGFENPVLMVFRGYVNGSPSTLIQHVSQINFLLTAIKREPDKPKRQIGFSPCPD